ncbi:MAG: response regulator transcription factor [Chrysiogenales bacterium]|nr:MAG: response regulator transcription factor [Chrysiogenales bacterium]
MHDDGAYSVLIVENEAPARELITDYLITRPELRLAGIARSGEDALRELSTREYDLVFMDIHLPRMSGIEVLDRLSKVPYVIFTTAYERYALRAFELGAVDYLLKPFSPERFDRSVDKFLSSRVAEERHALSAPCNGFSFRDGGKHHILPCEEIIYITSHGKKSVIHTVSDDIEISMMLKQIELKIPSGTFIRVHKRHIVNVHYVGALEYMIGGQYLVFLKDQDETSLPVGKKFSARLKSRLNLD